MKEDLRRISHNALRVSLSLLLGGAILYWMYRGFDFKSIEDVLLHQMDWTWMLLSFPFGIMAQVIRGWRWKQTLAPMGERPRTKVSVNAIFLSYATSLLIPRVGEFVRCSVLTRYDKVSFAKSLGTVVTERIIDTLLVALITLLTFVCQIRIFDTFFSRTGTNMSAIFQKFTPAGWGVTLICGVAVIALLYYLVRRLSIYNKVKSTLHSIWQGIISLKDVSNVPLFIFFTLAIWGCYFLHFYLTFFCFDATAHLSIICAMVTFIVGSIAVIVPTPNGAGPWHFAVKTMLILYGVGANDALYFVLIVHSIQTLLVILLGIYGWVSLSLTKIKA